MPGLRTTFLPVCPVAKSVAIKVLMEVSQASVKHSKMLPNIPRATKLALWCPWFGHYLHPICLSSFLFTIILSLYICLSPPLIPCLTSLFFKPDQFHYSNVSETFINRFSEVYLTWKLHPKVEGMLNVAYICVHLMSCFWRYFGRVAENLKSSKRKPSLSKIYFSLP